MLGVDTSSTEIADTGWCRAFIDTYESQTAVDVETLLQQTRTANGDYRGTPQESIAALLITLATSNEKVALKRDTDYVTDRRQSVGTYGRGEASRRCRFGSASIQSTPKRFERSCRRSLATIPTVATLTRGWPSLPRGSRTTACWSSGRSRASPESSTSPWTRWRAYWNRRTAAVTPPHRSWWRTASSPKRRRSQMHANSLLSTGSEGALGTVHRYPRSAGGTLPQCDHYLTDADDRGEWIRTDKDDSELTAGGCDWTPRRRTHVAQYRRVTGERCDVSDPEEICVVLTEWIRENESVVQALLDDATATFDGISLDDLEAVFEMAWNDGGSVRVNSLPPPCVSRPKRTRRFETSLGREKPVGAVAVGIRRSPGRATGLTDDGIS